MAWVAIAGIFSASPVLAGEEVSEPTPVDWGMKGVEAIGLKPIFDEYQLQFSGWLAQSFTFNADRPKDRINGFRVFDDRSNDYRINQFSLVFERVLSDGTSFDVGGKIQAIYGMDSRFIHAADVPQADSRFRADPVQIDPTQFYLVARLPVGNGPTVKLGKYVTTHGLEVIDAPGNPLYSHSYLFGFAIPFTHTGIQLDYPITETVGVYYGLVRGWDVLDQDPNGSFFHMAGTTIQWTEKMTTILNVITGPERQDEYTDYRTVVDVTAVYRWTDRFSTAVNADWGNESGVSETGKNWWGVAAYATYKFSPQVSSTLRAEYFRDETGSRLTITGDLTEVTLGADIHPFKKLHNLRFRPEVRWDRSFGDKPFDGGTKHNQFTVAGDVIFTF
jgi:hypothetical protein